MSLYCLSYKEIASVFAASCLFDMECMPGCSDEIEASQRLGLCVCLSACKNMVRLVVNVGPPLLECLECM